MILKSFSISFKNKFEKNPKLPPFGGLRRGQFLTSPISKTACKQEIYRFLDISNKVDEIISGKAM